MRPKAVVRAEWLYLAAVALHAVAGALVWDRTVAVYGTALTVADLAFTVGFCLLLVLFVTRRGSRPALAGLMVLTSVAVIFRAKQLAVPDAALGAAGTVLAAQAAALVTGAVLLVRPDARAWFNAPREGEPDRDAEERA